MSAEPADLIISLVSTTSVGYNLFLGGAMAKGKQLAEAQRGIAFSTSSAVSVSILILIVGSGFHQEGASEGFSISQLGAFIFHFLGTSGLVIFSLGFIGRNCPHVTSYSSLSRSRLQLHPHLSPGGLPHGRQRPHLHPGEGGGG